MEAIAIRLDGMETLAASSKTTLGLKGSIQGDASFSRVLDNAIKATDGVQKPVEYTKPQEKPYEKVDKNQERVAADDSKLKQMVSESDKAEETSDENLKTEDKAEEKAAVSEENKAEEKAALSDEKLENNESEEIMALVDENSDIEERAGEKVQDKKTKDSLVKNVLEPVLLHEEDSSSVAEVIEGEGKSDGLIKKSSKKNSKGNETAAVFSNIQAEKSTDIAKVDDELAADAMVHSAAARKEEAPLIEVIDERTQSVPENDKSSGLVSNVSYGDNGTAEMTLNLADPQAQAVTQAQEGVPVQEGAKSAFASMLSTEIKNNAGEFVKTGLITLRDNKSGTINLVLHPEELGNVKIKLELSDKLITGKIIVSSEEAYGAFKNNIESLRQAFLSSGFESAGFELAWSGSGESDGRHDDAEQGKNPHGFDYADSMPLAAGAEDMPDGYFGSTSVNMVV